MSQCSSSSHASRVVIQFSSEAVTRPRWHHVLPSLADHFRRERCRSLEPVQARRGSGRLRGTCVEMLWSGFWSVVCWGFLTGCSESSDSWTTDGLGQRSALHVAWVYVYCKHLVPTISPTIPIILVNIIFPAWSNQVSSNPTSAGFVFNLDDIPMTSHIKPAQKAYWDVAFWWSWWWCGVGENHDSLCSSEVINSD